MVNKDMKDWNVKMQFVPEMTRQEAIAKCYGIAHPEAFIQALEAIGLIKFKEKLSKEMEAICAIMIEIEVRSGPDYDKKYVAYPSVYGAGCLIDGLRNKGYEIVKINQK